MRKFILVVLLLVAPHCFAFAPAASDPVIDAFLKAQDEKTDPVLNAQISELMQAGYKERGSTSAVFLGGGCGVVGCINSYLVTTAYSTPGVNRRSRIVAAIVTNPTGREFRVRSILTRAGIECLVNPK